MALPSREAKFAALWEVLMDVGSDKSTERSPAALLAEVLGAGGCVHPIRISGTVVNGATGELRTSRMKLACKDRRAVLCPSCAALYQADAWILVSTGLIGGKGVAPEVASHPRVFMTLTAPSFGAVHRSVGTRRCSQRRGTCEHGLERTCRTVHDPEDPVVGSPICPSCFDYHAAVLWNAQATRLWNRTVQELARQIGAIANKSRDAVTSEVRLSYLRVAEFQRRGLVHLHVMLRADGRGDGTPPPPAWLDASVLADGAGHTIRRVRWLGALGASLFWGDQFDVAMLDDLEGQDQAKVASYFAKYATKTTGDGTALARRFRSFDDVRHASLTDHERRLVETAWQLHRIPELRHLNLRQHAHAFGYRGQLLTKSRGYSTTFGALRGVRAAYMAKGGSSDPQESSFSYDGRGYDHDRAAELAVVLAEMRAEHRRDLRAQRVANGTEVAR